MKHLKKFKDLSIGDEVFWINRNPSDFLNEKDRYGNVYENSIVNKTKIFNLKENNKGELEINKDGYDNKAFLTIDKDSLNKPITYVKNSYNRSVYFVNEKSYNEVIKIRVLREMKAKEKAASEFLERAKQTVIELRKAYYPYLMGTA